MRILFMGTPPFAASVMEALAARHDVCALVCQPDRKVGRKAVLTAPASKQAAMARGVPVLQPLTLKGSQVLRDFAGHAPEIIVVVAYGRLLPRAVLDLAPFGCLNLHASLLPEYRGAAPLQHALLNGADMTGLSVMRLDEGVDTGDILRQQPMAIGRRDDIQNLYAKAAEMGSVMLLDALDDIEKGSAAYTPQRESGVSYAPALTRRDGLVDFACMTGREIDCRVRALCQWPVAYFEQPDGHVKIHRAEDVEGSGRPGEVLGLDPLVIACARDAIRLDSVTPMGRRTMGGQQYAAGRRLKKGTNILV